MQKKIDKHLSNNEIIKFINYIKDKIIRTNIPSFFIKRTIYSIVFTISLIFDCSLALSFVQ